VSTEAIAAARQRLQSGRNELCPCGSGRKYKRCCLRADEDLVRQRIVVPPPQDRELSATERRVGELWQWFNGLREPSRAQMEELVEALLALPAEATDWYEVLGTCARGGHPDLPAVFRRISAAVPHTRATGMSSFYWKAAEIFRRKDAGALMAEVVAGYAKLGANHYDADALARIEDILLAGHFEAEALVLAEHFLPIVRADDQLMPYAAPEKCNLVFELRAGIALRDAAAAAAAPPAVARKLGRDLEQDIDREAIDRAAAVACDANDPAWTRAHFELVNGDIQESPQAWQDCLRLYDVLLRVAREASRLGDIPPGCAFVGLSRLLAATDQARTEDEDATSRRGKKAWRADNLLDALNPAALEGRIARACPELIGVNEARAQHLIEAHTVLLDFAGRHGLIADDTAAATRAELARLRGVLAAG
jgi:hypothetical protein